jgi:hypothetical protein
MYISTSNMHQLLSVTLTVTLLICTHTSLVTALLPPYHSHTHTTHNSIHVQWDEYQSQQGGIVDFYELSYRQSFDSQWHIASDEMIGSSGTGTTGTGTTGGTTGGTATTGTNTGSGTTGTNTGSGSIGTSGANRTQAQLLSIRVDEGKDLSSIKGTFTLGINYGGLNPQDFEHTARTPRIPYDATATQLQTALSFLLLLKF